MLLWGREARAQRKARDLGGHEGIATRSAAQGKGTEETRQGERDVLLWGRETRARCARLRERRDKGGKEGIATRSAARD